MFDTLKDNFKRVIFAILLSFLILNFGNALIFDRVLLLTIVTLAILLFPLNKNSFSILVIVTIELLFEEFNWLVIQEGLFGEVSTDSLLLKLYCYGVCAIGCYLERDEKVAKVMFGVSLISVVFEIYWLAEGVKPSNIYWFILVAGQALIVKHILFLRPHYLHRRFPHIQDWTWSPLDRDYMTFLKLKVLLEIAMIFEYLIRFTSGQKDIMFVYDSYTYIAHGINAYLLISVLIDSKNTIQLKFLKA